MKTVVYKNVIIAQNSEAYELYEKKDFKKLEAHLKELDIKWKRLEGRDS